MTKRNLWHEREIANVFLGLTFSVTRLWVGNPLGSYSGQGLFIWSPEKVQDLIQLVDVVAAFEKRAPSQKFCQNTSHGPQVDCGLGGV